jgi:hypothetical protein
MNMIFSADVRFKAGAALRAFIMKMDIREQIASLQAATPYGGGFPFLSAASDGFIGR